MEYHIKENGEGQKLFAYRLDKQTLNGHIPSSKVYVMKTPTPVGMTDIMTKLQSAPSRYWRSIPSLVEEYVDINKENYRAKNYSVSVSFSGKLLIFYSVMFSFTL